MAKKKKEYPCDFKNHWDAIKKADEEHPSTMATLKQTSERMSVPLQTKEDFRFFVLFNMVRAIDEELRPDLESTFLRRIQQNILFAAEKYLK